MATIKLSKLSSPELFKLAEKQWEAYEKKAAAKATAKAPFDFCLQYNTVGRTILSLAAAAFFWKPKWAKFINDAVLFLDKGCAATEQ